MWNGFIEFLQFMTYYNEYFAPRVNWWPNAIGAAVGAILAFCSTLLFHHYVERRNKWGHHLESLSNIERLLGQQFVLVGDNRYRVQGILMLSKREKIRVPITWDKLEEFQVVDFAYPSLLNNELKNSLQTLEVLLLRSNGTIACLSIQYSTFRLALIDQRITEEKYLNQVDQFVSGVQEIDKYFILIEDLLENSIGTCRALLKRDQSRRFPKFFFSLKSPMADAIAVSHEKAGFQEQVRKGVAEGKKLAELLSMRDIRQNH